MPTTLTASVGARGQNRPDDVRAVQALLARHAGWLAPAPAPAVTGVYDDALGGLITTFQREAGALLAPDGRVDPGGFTLRRLDMATIPHPAHAVFADGPATHAPGAPAAQDYALAATQLGCGVAEIQAVSQVEVGIVGPWNDTGRPTILYERHVFSALTAGEWDVTHPDISNPVRGGYGRFSAQYPKLKRAATLNEEAALKSASWGAYQIVGRYHAQAGETTVAAFVTGEMESERRQLQHFVSFVLGNPVLVKALKDHDWTTFARVYNGPAYRENDYDTKMGDAYAALAPPPPPPPPGAHARPGPPARPGARP